MVLVEKVVYVLGAGASNDAGGPLISDFFSMNTEKNERVHLNYFRSKEKYLALEAAYDRWAKDVDEPNVEGFFQRVEYQTLMRENFDSHLPEESHRPETLYRYLVWYIGAYVRNSVADQGKPQMYYRSFAESLKQPGKRFSVITFNYDLVLERAMLKELGELDYKLGRIWGHKRFCHGVPLLKLHGSLNWLWCPKCKEIFVDDKSVAHKYNRESCLKKCGGLREPLIVPPNPQKGECLKTIHTLWQKADTQLKKADRIVVVGYSLPDADTSAKQLLKESVQNANEFDIINSSPDAFSALEKKLERKSDIQIPTPFRDYVRAITS